MSVHDTPEPRPYLGQTFAWRRPQPALVLAALACLVILLAQPIRRNTIVGVWTDDAYYIARAESLARGLGMRQLEVPGAPADRLAPPGFPMLLAPFVVLWPGSYLPMRLFSLGLHVLGLVLIYGYCRFWLGVWPALGITTLYGLHVEPLSMSVQVGSEPAFVCLVFVALMALDRDDAVPRANASVAWLAIAGAVVVKILGLALAAAHLAQALWHRRWRNALGAGLIVMLSAVWILRSSGASDVASGPPSTTYVGEIQADSRGTAERLSSNAVQYAWQTMPFMLLPGLGGASAEALLDRLGLGFVDEFVKLMLLGLLIGGFLLTARRRISVGHLWLLAHLALLVGFIKVSPRYLIPVLPLLYLYCAVAIGWLVRRWPSPTRGRFKLLAAVALTAALVASFGYQYRRAVAQPIASRVFDPRIGTEWLRDNVTSSAPVLYNDRRSGYLYTGRPIVPIPPGTKGPSVESLICEQGVEHVIVTPLMVYDTPFAWSPWAARVLVPELEHSSEVRLIHQSDEGLARVYEIGAGYCHGWRTPEPDSA